MRAVALALVLSACITSGEVVCEDGSRCPANTVCSSLTTMLGTERVFCATSGQRVACADKAEGDPCDLPGTTTGSGACRSGACVLAECGNGLLDPGEVCDDENLANDDDCSADCRSTLTCGNAVLDLSRGEQCDAGDALSHDGCASTCQLESPRWIDLPSERPSAREFASLAYDRGRRRIVLFGGNSKTTPSIPLDDTREWDGERWHAAGNGVLAPSNRYGHAMAYDAARDQLVVFSGSNNQNDTWVTVAGAWQQLAPAHSPPSRYHGRLAYDGARKQVVLFGGFSTQTQDNLGDTWIWDGNDWHELTPAIKPSARVGHAMAYDPARNVTVLFGGEDTALTDEVWEFDGTSWANRTPTVPGPTARAFAAMAYDPTIGEVVIAGGSDGGPQTDVFSWNGTRWLARPALPSSGDTFVGHSMAADPVRGRLVVLGTTGSLYELGTSAWTSPPGGSVGKSPLAREGHVLALDSSRDEIVMFGGNPSGSAELAETWVWNGGWNQVAPQTSPDARTRAAMAFDERRGEIVMYGGCASNAASAETWVWVGGSPVGTWTLKVPTSLPGKRCDAAMAFDAKRGQIVLFGGQDGTPTFAFATTTWTWDGGTWTAAGGSSPPARQNPAMAYDPVRERVVLFGGRRPTGFLDFDDTWVWDGSAWTELAPVTRPPARAQAALAWDPSRARLVLTGGYSTEALYAFADAYEWDGTDWRPTASDYPQRRMHAMTTAPDGAGVLMFGGDGSPNGSIPRADTLRLRWDGDTGYEACTDRDGDADGLVGCLDPDCSWICTPSCTPGTTCDPNAPRCGDGTCNARLETCVTCPGDCGACPLRCGDFDCSPGETGCPGDCTP